MYVLILLFVGGSLGKIPAVATLDTVDKVPQQFATLQDCTAEGVRQKQTATPKVAATLCIRAY